MVHFIDSGGHFRQPVNVQYKYFCSACFLHTGSLICTCQMRMPQKPKPFSIFSRFIVKKKPHIICEVFCSPVVSRLLLFLWSWLKVLQSYSQIKLPQLICCTATFRQSFKYVWFWIEIKCHLWEICLLLALDIAFG